VRWVIQQGHSARPTGLKGGPGRPSSGWPGRAASVAGIAREDRPRRTGSSWSAVGAWTQLCRAAMPHGTGDRPTGPQQLGHTREAATRGPYPGRRDRAEPLADPTRGVRPEEVAGCCAAGLWSDAPRVGRRSLSSCWSCSRRLRRRPERQRHRPDNLTLCTSSRTRSRTISPGRMTSLTSWSPTVSGPRTGL
jgi:hypothetical protein